MANMRPGIRSTLLACVSAAITGIIIAVSCVVLLVAVGVRNFQSTQPSSEDSALVLGTIETGSVEKQTPVQVHTQSSSSLEISSAQFGPGVVTGAPPGEGASLSEGDVLVAVNESPVIVIRGVVPAYRNIGQGMRGNDVRQLQDYLQRSGASDVVPDGFFGASTAAALAELYESRGFPRVTAEGEPTSNRYEVGLPLSRYVFVPSVPVLVGAKCGLRGQPTGTLTCVLRSEETTLAISSTSELTLTGLPVKLSTSSGEEFTGTVGEPVAPVADDATADASAAEDESRQWYSLVIEPEDAQNQKDVVESAQVVVETSTADGLRVPATAIREAAGAKTYVREPAPDQRIPGDAIDHPVEVILCADGGCAIRGDGIIAGMKVVLLG